VSADGDGADGDGAAGAGADGGGDDNAPAAASAYFAVAAAMVGFALFYALPIYARLQRPYYDPLARRWFLADHSSPIPMGYVGQLLWALGGALVCGGIAFAIVSGRRRTPGDRAFALWSAWALTAVAIVVAYFTWNNWP
jgi:hypothetical protein